MTAEEACTNIVGERPACCTNPDPASASCTIICPDRSPVDLPDKIIDSEDDLTCKDLNQIISFLTDDEYAYEVRSAAINSASCWCGCVGLETPDACFICDPEEYISGQDAIYDLQRLRTACPSCRR
jgi:hypothetical protein